MAKFTIFSPPYWTNVWEALALAHASILHEFFWLKK
jgi:hypothetical protein